MRIKTYAVNEYLLKYIRCFYPQPLSNILRILDKLVTDYRYVSHYLTYNIHYALFNEVQKYLQCEKIKAGTLIDQINNEIIQRYLHNISLPVGDLFVADSEDNIVKLNRCKIDRITFKRVNTICFLQQLDYYNVFQKVLTEYLDNYTEPIKIQLEIEFPSDLKLKINTYSKARGIKNIDYIVQLAFLDLIREIQANQANFTSENLLEAEEIFKNPSSCLSSKLPILELKNKDLKLLETLDKQITYIWSLAPQKKKSYCLSNGLNK